MTAWKAFELRIAKALGGERRGPQGKALSDIIGTPWAVECKRSKRGVPEGAWIEQARRNGAKEKKPWVLVVARHYDHKPIVVMEFAEFLRLAVRELPHTPDRDSRGEDSLPSRDTG